MLAPQIEAFSTGAKMQYSLKKDIISCFAYSRAELWEQRPEDNEVVDEKTGQMRGRMYLGRYFRTPKESDPLFALHQELLVARQRIDEPTFSQYQTLFNALVAAAPDLGEQAQFQDLLRQIADLRTAHPALGEYIDKTEAIYTELKARMIATAETFRTEMPRRDPIANDDSLGPVQNLALQSQAVVEDHIHNSNPFLRLANGKAFANSLGLGVIKDHKFLGFVSDHIQQ